ncbi:hypothetical protein EIP91_000420 [Steccherinum ochraceum]|uniref:Uncharacterized protein n=1 Tax=Steccherinum ochraceum TaxID=92696 RepID=A0A4R0RJX6_9APHY|nr:hypothetical protein EIP91_000420 [Steccherinum ochraceum]
MSEKGPYQPPPKYMTDFSKALASEVKILLAEVGKLRDERRQLQYEIADLMATRSKYGSGGEYAPNWAPKREATPPPVSPPPVPLAIEDVEPARPAWRTIHKKPESRRSKQKALPAPPAAPAPMPEPQVPANLPAWAQWRPNPLLSPQPQLASPGSQSPAMMPPRAGLFGTPSPPP